MPQSQLLKRVAGLLDGSGISYMLTGSLASSLQGEPRATHDIDLVVELGVSEVSTLAGAFPPPDYYLSDSAAQQAVRRKSMFNLIETATGDKVDFWILRETPFDRSRFSRRRRESVFGFTIWVSSPEDTILMKLKWAKDSGGSEKQFGDALRVYEVQYATLDGGYLEEWIDRLGLAQLWNRLRSEAKPL